MSRLSSLSLLVALAACAGEPIAEQLGANAVDRTYAVSAQEAMDGTLAALSDLNLKVERREVDALGGNLTARRADGSEVLVAVKGLEMRKSRVSIRVGEGDLALANIVQNQVAERIKKGTGKGPAATQETARTAAPIPPVKIEGATAESTYNVNLKTASEAGRSALKTLGINVADEQTEERMVSLSAQRGSAPIRIYLRQVEPNSTHVTFTVGSAKSADNESLLQQIKREFESALSAGDRP